MNVRPASPAPAHRRASLLVAPTVLAVVAAAALVSACGGGGGGGIGSGGTGMTASATGTGIVEGFGSIFVGGQRCEDTRAKVTMNAPAGAPDAGSADVKLGQRVQIVFDPASSTCKLSDVQIDPEVVGVVTSLSPLTVAGQRVAVVTDGVTAPATVYEGFASGAGIRLGDRVEVHGQPVITAGTTSIQASRIELKPAGDTWVRAKGVVTGLAAGQFTIGGLTVKTDNATQTAPANLALADGQTVVVWSTGAIAGDGSVTARVIKLAARTLEDSQIVRVEGPVSGCGASPCTTPTVDGLTIDVSGATFASGAAADVANGVLLRVEGSYGAAAGKVVATKASVRRAEADAGEVTLIGAVSDFVSAGDFSVRGVPVTTDGSSTVGAGCTIAPAQIVAVKGHISQAHVQATRVDCLALADGVTLDIFGALVNVDLAAKTFSLSEGPYRNLTLTWDDDTKFGGSLVAAALANNLRVGLRAVLVDGRLLVKRLLLDPVPANAPAGVQLFGNFGIAQDVTAGSLSVRSIQMAIVPGATTLVGEVVSGAPVRTWFYRTGPLAPWTALQVSRVSWN